MTKKKILSFIVIVAMLCSMISFGFMGSLAVDPLECTLDDSGKLTITGNGELTSLDWGPDEIFAIEFGEGNITIGDGFFDSYYNIETITFGSGTVTIGAYSFIYCENLATITFGSGTVKVGEYAFGETPALETITFGSGNVTIDYQAFVYSSVKSLVFNTSSETEIVIDNEAFVACNNLTDITFGNGTVTIGAYSFVYCENLATITFGSGTVKVGEYAFGETPALETITFGSGNVTIDYQAFVYSSVKSLVFNTSSETEIVIDNEAFVACNNLTDITFGNGNVSIGTAAFADCYALEKVTFGDGAVTVGDYAFAGCPITSLTFGDGNTTIGNEVFVGCNLPSEITIPKNVTAIGENAFENLELIYVEYDENGPSAAETYAIDNGIPFMDPNRKSTVIFVDWDGTLLCDSVEICYGESFSVPDAPTRENYDFIGWGSSVDGINTDSLIAEDVTFTATYKAYSYTVTFVDLDKSQIGETQIIEHGNMVNVPDNPTRTGYVFSGWKGSNGAKITDPICADTVFTAKYDRATFVVTFKDYDGSVLKAQTVSYGNKATAPKVENKENMEFIGWDVDFSNVTSKLTVTAQYNITGELPTEAPTEETPKTPDEIVIGPVVY